MAGYRCRFFGTMPTRADSFTTDLDQDFWAETDEHARKTAESMCDLFRDHVSGFEVWQGGRLVCRETAPAGPIRFVG